MRSRLTVAAFVLLLVTAVQAQDVEIQVELMNGVGTGTSHKGDLISARVLSPAALQGDIVEGKVGKVDQGGGKAVLTFAFETLRHAGQAVPISSEIRSIANSKGQADVDENGNSIHGSRSQAKPSGVARAGGALGGLMGGKKGAAVSAASRTAEAILSIDLASDGPSLTLAPGSRITLMAKSRSGTALAGLAPNPAPASPAATGGATTAAAAPAATPAPQSGGQPDLTAVKAEFVPGDKVILYDDFSDMEGDEPPPHWKVRGGTAELRVGNGIRQLTMTAQRVTLTPNVTGLPANFTMETDVVSTDKGGEELTGQQIDMDWTKPVKQALWLQNGRMRYYVNGQRVMDVNQIVLPELGKIEVYIDGPGDNDKTGYVGFQFARFAESAPDFSKVLMSSGRYVTRGILFDTDSDRIKPESAPVVKMIAKGLEANPTLKLLIEGHTDSTGDADHNLDLSKRRAEALKAILVAQFKIDASRLTTAGLGATKPVDTNDTPQGRSQNRRVELVKQ
jgi:outer membrane protein OmpA-like peptidoglycan-associated protein